MSALRDSSARRRLVAALLLAATLALGLAGCGGGGDQLGDVIFQDEFATGQTGAWRVEADASGSSAIVDEQLRVSLQSSESIQYAALTEPQFDDLILEVDATLLDGSPGGSYGFLFRVQESGGFYRYNITGDGFFILERFDGRGNWTRLTDGWEETAAINQGVGATNHLKVVVGGPNMLLFVNGEPLGQFTDSGGFARGSIATNAGTFGNPNLTVAFDNVLVREP